MDQSILAAGQVSVSGMSPAGGSAEFRTGRRPDLQPVNVYSSATGRINLSRVTLAVRHLVGSVEPARMFTELAQVCVPAISDACTIDLVEEGGRRYRIRQPAENLYGSRGFEEEELVAKADFSPTGQVVHGFPGC